MPEILTSKPRLDKLPKLSLTSRTMLRKDISSGNCSTTRASPIS
jgi:hypothetical protein